MFERPVHVKEEPECHHGARTGARDDPTGFDTHQGHKTEGLEFRIEVSCVKVEPSDELYADHMVKEELVLGPECIHSPNGLVLHGTLDATKSSLTMLAQEQSSAQQECVLATCEAINNTKQREIQQQITTQQIAATHVYKCDVCGVTHKRKNDLIYHIKAHQREFQRKTPKFPFKKRKSCNICKMDFTNLTTHKRTHTGEKLFACKTCKKSFSRLDHLQAHQQIHGVKQYCCDICFKEFAQSKTLTTHRRIHTGEKPFSCKLCPKQFRQYSNLEVHERTHTGEKPFKCEVCSKTFAILSGMKRHHRIHTGDKPYSCKICKKKFNMSHHLKRHKEIHRRKKLIA